MTVTIGSANAGAALDVFIGLPARLYSAFPEYTAPLTMDRESVLQPDKASFFKHGIAQYWIAYRDGEPVGRISAQIDYSQPAGVFDDAGLFGCIDAIDDPEVTGRLLDAAESWLHQQGRKRSIGPFLLSINGEPGLLVEGRDEPPLLMVPWHPAYLEDHLVANGYAPLRDLHYWRLADIPQRISALRSKSHLDNRIGDLVVRKLDMKNLASDVEIMRQVYNDAWKDNWGFVPLEKADIQSISTDLKPFIKPEFGFIAELGGRAIAVAMFVPNLFEITRDIGAKPSLLGWVKLGTRMVFHTFGTGHIILLGVLSEYRHSLRGAMLAMALVQEILERLSNYNHRPEWLEAGWVLDDNAPMHRILTQYGFEKKRTLRLFDKQLPFA